MSSGSVDPISFPETWDVIIIGQATSPGLCKISDVKRGFEWDVKKGKGTLGGTVTFTGRPPAKFSVTFRLWLADHFTEWDLFRPLLKFDPTKKTVRAVDIYHPALADIEIHSVVTEGIGGIIHEGDGMYTITVEFIEYFPPPKAAAVGTPSGSKSPKDPKTNTTGASDDPIADAQQKQIAALLQKASAP